jgi:hypothetical protein
MISEFDNWILSFTVCTQKTLRIEEMWHIIISVSGTYQ